jgi:hypothetical protein
VAHPAPPDSLDGIRHEGIRLGRLFVAGYLGYLKLGGLTWDVDPPGVAVTGDVDADERAEGVRVNAVVAVTHDGPVDVIGDDEGQRVSRGAERLLHAGGVEQAEGDVESFAEASVAVVVDFSGVQDDADAELPVQTVGSREAGVVIGQELAERGDGAVQQDGLGGPVDGVDEGEEAVAAVSEPVAMAPVDARRAQRLVEQLVERAAEFGLDRIGAAGGLLDVDGDDGPVPRRAEVLTWPSINKHDFPCTAYDVNG